MAPRYKNGLTRVWRIPVHIIWIHSHCPWPATVSLKEWTHSQTFYTKQDLISEIGKVCLEDTP